MHYVCNFFLNNTILVAANTDISSIILLIPLHQVQTRIKPPKQHKTYILSNLLFTHVSRYHIYPNNTLRPIQVSTCFESEFFINKRKKLQVFIYQHRWAKFMWYMCISLPSERMYGDRKRWTFFILFYLF